MNKKWLAGFLAIMLPLMIVIGCSSGGSGSSSSPSPSAAAPSDSGNGEEESNVYPENGLPKDEKVTLKYAHWENGYGREWIDVAIKQFTDKYPNVSFDIQSSPKINTVLSTLASAGNDNDMFDIMMPYFNGSDENLLKENGKFEPLEDLWEREVPDTPGKKVKDIVRPSAYENRNIFTKDGHEYTLPMGGSIGGIFFNKNMFEENGWNQNPKTWTEFVDLLETIKQAGVIPITFPGIYMTYINNGFAQMDLQWIHEEGGDEAVQAYMKEYQDYEKPDFAYPTFVKRWEHIYELGQKGYFPEGVAALNHTQSQMQVIQGRAAMVPTGDWVENEMKESTPDGFQWGFMAVPANENPNQKRYVSNSIGAGGFLVWKNKPELNKKWAKEFILHMYNMDRQLFNAENAGIFPIRADFGDDPERVAKMQGAPRAAMQYTNDNPSELIVFKRHKTRTAPELSSASKLFNESITNIATGKQDPKPIIEQALAEAMKGIESGK